MTLVWENPYLLCLMQVDLEGLEITPGEIHRISGVRKTWFYQPLTQQKLFTEGAKTFLASGLLVGSCVLLAQILPDQIRVLILIHGLLGIGLLADDAHKFFITLRHQRLGRILEDIDRYNALVKVVKVYDEVQAVGNAQIQLHHRGKVLAAFRLLREDLIRALKTEKVLLKNRKFLDEHPDLFATNLETLIALQISDRSTEHGRLLNEALQVATEVQSQIQQFQQQLS
ncbi:MAG: hypothetical protein ACFBSC_20205 [Microcoleaceae cyanobacterium]